MPTFAQIKKTEGYKILQGYGSFNDLSEKDIIDRSEQINSKLRGGIGKNRDSVINNLFKQYNIYDNVGPSGYKTTRSLGQRLGGSAKGLVEGAGTFIKDIGAPLALAAYGGMALDGALTAGAAGTGTGAAVSSGSALTPAAGTLEASLAGGGLPAAGGSTLGAGGLSSLGAGGSSTAGGFLSSDFGKMALLQVGSGLYSANRAGKASDQLVDATNRATDIANQQFEQTMGNLQPYMESGIAGNEALLSRLGITMGADGLEYGGSPFQDFSFDPNNLENTPGYQFRLNQGLQGVERSASARGMLGSGNMMAALTDYAQGMASQEYQAEYNRQLTGYQTNLNTQLADLGLLQSLSNSGQNAAIGAGGFSTQQGNILADLKSQLGRDEAAGTMGQSSAFQNMFSDLSSAYMADRYFGDSTQAPNLPGQQQTYNPYLEYGRA